MEVIDLIKDTFKGLDLKITKNVNNYQMHGTFKIEFNNFQLYKLYTGLLVDATTNYNNALDLYRTGKLTFNELKVYNYRLKEINDNINELKKENENIR